MRRGVRGWVAASLAAALVGGGAVTAAVGTSSRDASAASIAASTPSKCINAPGAERGRPILGELHTLGVRVWSTGISWAAIARSRPTNPQSPDDPAYVWPAGLDNLLDSARALHIEPVLYVNGFPSWSNGGRSSVWAPLKPGDYADFMAAAVRKYPQVRRWIAFSEPSQYVNFRPQGGRGKTAPRLYARLLDAAYGEMHAARPDVVVIGGNVHPAGLNDATTTAPDTFLRYMVLPNGRRPRLDMFGINPYTERPLSLRLPHRPNRVDFDDLDWLAHRLDQIWPGRHLKLFVGEFGWNTEHEAQGWLFHVSRREQAARLRSSYRLAAQFGRVDTLCWFQLYDSPPSRVGSQWWNWTSGLRTWNGTRKRSWRTFRNVPSGPVRP